MTKIYMSDALYEVIKAIDNNDFDLANILLQIISDGIKKNKRGLGYSKEIELKTQEEKEYFKQELFIVSE